jgi:pimeloyl-ACP methyl ester carboxylesterase
VTKATARAADGLTIAYDVRGRGDMALVFLHGWCGDRDSWKHQLDAFAGDYRVVAIDMGGHGESGKDRKNWSVTGLAGDVEAVVKALGLKRMILIGHSMGGPIALEAARRMPGAVVAVIGVDTLQNAELKSNEEQSKKILEAFEKDFKGTMRMGITMMLPEKADPELIDSITARASAQDQKMALALFRDFPRLDMKALLRDAKVPVRCINAVPSSKLAVATAPDDPTALTLYVATNQFGRLNVSRIIPRSSAVTSESRDHVLPWSSFTRTWTTSPGCHSAPESVTSSPGA